MQCEIITIGDELLIGQVVDTNSAWMAQQLNMAGISVKQITSVSDNKEHIIEALNEARDRAVVVLITGGLGPTKDDITKKTLCDYFDTKLVFNEEAYEDIKELFARFGKEVTLLNRKQAEVPANCSIIRNKNGTAPGMWFEVQAAKGGRSKQSVSSDATIFVSMPGVPYEMKAMMNDFVIPELKKKFKLPHIIHKTILTQGIGESFLSEMIAGWEESLKKEDIRLAYLPSPGTVRLRMSVKGFDKALIEEAIDRKTKELSRLIPDYIYGEEEYGEEKVTLAQIVGELLREKKQTLSTAESCTGGYIAHLITSMSGSSDYYTGSVVAYGYEIKEKELGVKAGTLKEFGAVSKETVEEMARGALKKFNTSYVIAVTGIAGPSGATPEKPVGTVWICIARAGSLNKVEGSAKDGVKLTTEKFLFGNNRKRNIQKTADAALNMLRKAIS